MPDLTPGVHAGIGASRRMHDAPLAEDALDGCFDRLLHRRSICLALPADKRRAVIFDRQLVAIHQVRRAPANSRAPRRKLAASIGALPARCTLRSLTAPLPHAIVS